MRKTLARNSVLLGTALGILAASAIAGSAQIKPATSGEPSFNEPEMKPHASGLTRPNAPRRRGRRHRVLHPAAPLGERP